MNVSIVSVSRRAGPPHLGHVAFMKASDVANGDTAPDSNLTSSGRRTGNSSSGTSCSPHLSQYTTGIGTPQ